MVEPDWQNTVTAALMGCEVLFPKDNYPICRHLPEARLGDLRVPDDLWSAFPYDNIAAQVAQLNRKLGAEVKPTLPIRGILNEAVILRGDALLTDMLCEPERAQRVIGFSADLLERQLRTNGGGCMILNCTVPMIGPRRYRERILSLDRRVAEVCRRQDGEFAIHHCGRIDDYLPLYRQLSAHVAGLEVGHESDTRKVLECFPETRDVWQIIEAGLINSGAPAAVGRTGRPDPGDDARSLAPPVAAGPRHRIRRPRREPDNDLRSRASSVRISWSIFCNLRRRGDNVGFSPSPPSPNGLP